MTIPNDIAAKVARVIPLDEFHSMLKQQEVPREHLAFRCPMCGTIQSASDLIDAGAGRTFDEVEKYLAFSCVGRWTGAKAPRGKPDGRPCDWTLGGLFQCHKLTVKTPEGGMHPRFEPVSPAEAQAHQAAAIRPRTQADAPAQPVEEAGNG